MKKRTNLGGEIVKEKRRRAEQARKKLREKLEPMIKATSYLLEPLKTLNEEQVAAVVTLSLLTQGVTGAARALPKSGKDVVASFKKELVGICPELQRGIRSDPCFDLEITYLSALKKCEDEGRREDECWEAYGWEDALVHCYMKKLENSKGTIRDILSKLKPPKPTPWPER